MFAVVSEQHIGSCRAVSTKKNSFRPKMAKNCQFFAENSVFLAEVVSFRAPKPILRVPDPVKCVWNCIGTTYWVLQGRQHRKKTVFVQKWPKNYQYLAKNSVFLENNRVGGTPLSYFERAELKKKGFLWSFRVQNLFSWYFCDVRWCAALFCSTTPEQTTVLQNRPSSRDFDGLRESSDGRSPPICIWGQENPNKRAISVESPL